MTNLSESVKASIQTRENAMGFTIDALTKGEPDYSEVWLRDEIKNGLLSTPTMHGEGWYDPPPHGIAVLFGESDNLVSLQFDTLRNKQFWPNAEHKRTPETVGILYVSPVDKSTGIIGDLGSTFYTGKNQAIREHLCACLEAVEVVAEHAEVGMEFRQLHEFSQQLFAKKQLDQTRIVTINDPLGTNIGHTVPWSYEAPTADEQQAIETAEMSLLKDIISRKRLYLNRVEEFKIPETIAFTVESRLESYKHPELPNCFFHLIVTFQEGKKRVVSNFNPFFKALGMDYIRSRF